MEEKVEIERNHDLTDFVDAPENWFCEVVGVGEGVSPTFIGSVIFYVGDKAVIIGDCGDVEFLNSDVRGNFIVSPLFSGDKFTVTIK